MSVVVASTHDCVKLSLDAGRGGMRLARLVVQGVRCARLKRRTWDLWPVTEQPMMRPWRRTPRYHLGPMRVIFTSSKPAAVNQSMYSCSVGNSIHASAKKREMGKVGCTGPMRHASPPGLITRYASCSTRACEGAGAEPCRRPPVSDM